MSDLSRLVRYAGRHKALVAVGVACSIVGSVLLGGFVGLVKPLTEQVLLGQPPAVEHPPPVRAEGDPRSMLDRLKARADELSRPARDWLGRKPFVSLPLLIVVIFGIRGVFTYAAGITLKKVGLYIINDLRLDLFARIVRQSDSFFRSNPTGLLMSRVMNDVSRLQRLMSADFGHFLRVMGNMVVGIVLALYYSWQITAICLVGMPLVAVPVVRFGRRVKRMSTRSQERAAEISNVLVETLRGNRVVQSFGMEDFELGRFRRGLGRMLEADIKAARAVALSPAVVELIGAIFSALVFAFAGYRIATKQLGGGELLVVIVSLGLIFTGIRRLSAMNNDLQRTLAACRRVYAMMDAPVEIRDAPAARELPRLRRELRFERVDFGYGAMPVLHEVDLTVRTGEVHALVGPSGAGKTTLVSLVPRFYDPSAGRVTLDGHDLREVTLRSLRDQIALVTQETILFDGTVRENIAYGRGAVPQEQVEAAARAANAHAFIEGMEKGYDTMVGESGGRLSAGQRQRIAIARALLKDAPILILDEATSALDTESEAQVQEALDRLMEGRTTLVIAHRLSTVRRATRIHVLDAGRIVESGTHDELIARGGLYARLHALQFRLEETDDEDARASSSWRSVP